MWDRPDWDDTTYLSDPQPQITTYEGFVEWRSRQGMDANIGTALGSRRFRKVPFRQLRQWFVDYDISRASATSRKTRRCAS